MIDSWRQWRISCAADGGPETRPRRALTNGSARVRRFRAGVRELDRRLSNPARAPIADVPPTFHDRVMHEIEVRAHGEARDLPGPSPLDRPAPWGSWQRMIGLAIAALIAGAAFVMPAWQRGATPGAVEASRARSPSPELAVAGLGQTVVRLFTGGPSAVVPTPIGQPVLDGTREMGEKAMAFLSRLHPEDSHRAKAPSGIDGKKGEDQEGAGGKSKSRPGEPGLNADESIERMLLAVQVVARLT